MLAGTICALALLPLCWAATKTPLEKVVELADAAPDGVIQLNEQTFDLLTSSKREWSVVVQLTALSKSMKCTPCKEFDPTFHEVSRAWKSVPKTERDKHFFASLDFADGEAIFRRLAIMSAPIVTLYPAAQGPNRPPSGKIDPFNYDFNNYGKDAKDFAAQLSQFTSVPIPYKDPIDWGLVLSLLTTTVLCAVTARALYPVLVSRWTWAAGTILTILVMTSGFMFVRIRGMPYRTAEHSMIPGYQNQVGAEIWTVASKYFTLSTAFLVLILGAPRQAKESFQKPAIYLCVVIIALTFSALIKDFKVKNGGYPFSYVF